jgi:FMN phosphatase YigB (HAD superfamily)
VRYRAVFFDAGETLVHPAPSFPELFAQVLEREGHRVLPDDVLAASRAVTARFSEASRDGSLWTTSPERSRAFWSSVYVAMLGELGLPSQDGLRDSLYGAFTDRANYALFGDVRAVLEGLASEGYTLGLVSNFEGGSTICSPTWASATRSRCEDLGERGHGEADLRIYRLALDARRGRGRRGLRRRQP